LLRVCQKTATDWYCNPGKELVNAEAAEERSEERSYIGALDLQALFLSSSSNR